jgi:hypothetical protein
MSVTYDFHFFDRFKAFAAICVFTAILRSWSCCLLLMRRLKPDYLFVLWLFCRDCRKQDLYRSIAIVSSTSIHDPCVPFRFLRKKERRSRCVESLSLKPKQDGGRNEHDVRLGHQSSAAFRTPYLFSFVLELRSSTVAGRWHYQ